MLPQNRAACLTDTKTGKRIMKQYRDARGRFAYAPRSPRNGVRACLFKFTRPLRIRAKCDGAMGRTTANVIIWGITRKVMGL